MWPKCLRTFIPGYPTEIPGTRMERQETKKGAALSNVSSGKKGDVVQVTQPSTK